MPENISISFAGFDEHNKSSVVVYNPKILSPQLLSQILRCGLRSTSGVSPQLIGNLKGTREAFTRMIESYGVGVDIVESA